MTRPTSWMLGPIVFLAAASCARAPQLAVVQPNDNRTAAGTLTGDTLRLRLTITMAVWHPESDTGVSLEVAAFQEDGKPPTIPAPLIRVRQGAHLVVSVRNALRDSTLTISGLAEPGKDDSLVLKPGDSAVARFDASVPGTYLYLARPGKHNHDKDDEREQTAGAFIVDPKDGAAPDRVFVINIWGNTVDSTTYPNALAINGKSWPYDERISATVGDTLRWRVINPTDRPHPMHLHGFYFQLETRGGQSRDTAFAPAVRPLMVTQTMVPRSTMLLRWSPDRPGQWLFHCHIGFHVTPENARPVVFKMPDHATMSDDPGRHMAGLILGINVKPPALWTPPARRDPEQVRLLIQEGRPHHKAKRALAFVLDRGGVAADSVQLPGPVLTLTRGRPTDITVVNRLKESGAVHWHGIELESYSDGVVGLSGMDSAHVARSIAANDSFTAHLTLPRAGTFIYHTHINDIEQLSSGLYGAIVVLEPGQRLDPQTDHVFVTGWDGPGDNAYLVNGDSTGPSVTWRSDADHRIRLVNIGAAGEMTFVVRRDTTVQAWRSRAMDGADLPSGLRVTGPARATVDVGETRDFVWRPAPGTYRFSMHRGSKQKLIYSQVIVVR